MNYYSRTYESPNPLIRFAHRKRLQTALDLIPVTPALSLLDYGCGDGLFLRELAKRHDCANRVFGFEPFMETLPNLEVCIHDRWEKVEAQFRDSPVSMVTCFEVLEHLPPEMQAETLCRIRGIMQKHGRALISVPIESGLPSLPKNLFRRMRYGSRPPHPYTARNIIKSFLGEPIPECRSGKSYLSHMGFYYKDLEILLKENFEILKKVHSPISALGSGLNSQIFYILEPRQSVHCAR